MSIDAVGILAGTHELLPELFLMYTGGDGPESCPAASHDMELGMLGNTTGDGSGWDELFEEEISAAQSRTDPAGGDEGPLPLPHIGSNGQDRGHVQGNQDQHQENQQQTGMFNFADFNKQQKLLAKDWVRSSPFTRLCIMKEVAEHLMALMYRFLRLSGTAWEKHQRFRASQGMKRSYPILDAAFQDDLQICIDSLCGLLFMPPRCVGREHYSPLLKALRFRMVSCAVCSLHVLLRHPRRGFPYSLFKMLVSDEHAEVILSTPSCFHDELTHEILKEYEA